MSALLKKIQQDLNLGAVANPKQYATIKNTFRDSVRGLNDYTIQAVRAKSATQAYTEAIIKQEVGFGKAIRSRRLFNDVLREQYQLQRMTAIQYSRDVAGNVTADVIVPKGVPEQINKMAGSWKYNAMQVLANKKNVDGVNEALDMFKMRIGIANQLLGSGATKMINWGKNTQWAGRQLTVGLSVPLAAFAALAGKAAYDADKQLTRIIKVYDFTSKGPAQAAEAQALYNDSLHNGILLARTYGAALNDTLDVEAQLAATGLKGSELLKSTNQVQRASILGEMDKQETIKATIALQATLHHSSSQLADDFNYMNAVENATNLTMQDFVQAIPRALGPLSQLGVSLQDMGVLLATMKSRGIEASQGANALKSGLNRVLNPAHTVTETLANFGINLDEIVKNSGGNFMKILVALSDKMKGLDNLARAQIIGKLFGTYQFSRVNAIIQGLQDVHDKTTQVGRAFMVSQQSATSWGNVATQEMNRIQQSASGKFHRAVESLKAQFAELGKPFLEAATMILHGITGIISHLNKMPHSFKVFTMLGIMAVAALGPIIMLAGLIPNLIGNVLKFVHMALDPLGNGFKAMTAQERAAQMLGEQHSYVWKNEANAAQALAGAVAELTRNFQLLAYEERAARMGFQAGPKTFSNGMVGPNLIPVGYGEYQRDRPGGPFASKAEIAEYKAIESQSKVAEEEAVKTERNWGKIATHAVRFSTAASLGMMVMSNGSSKLLNNITNTLFVASLIGPSLAKGIKAVAATKALSGLFGAFREGRAAGGIAAGLRAALPVAGRLFMTFGRFAGPLGIAATIAGGIGLHFLKTWQQQKQNEKAQREINTSAEAWANTLGYVYQDYKAIGVQQKKNAGDAESILAAKFAKERPAMAEILQNLKNQHKEQDLLNAAIYEGLKAREHGASQSEAEQVVRVAFRVAGYKDDDINRLMAQVLSQVNFGNDSSVVGALNTQFSRIWNNIRTGNVKDVKEAAKGLGMEFANAFSSEDPQTRLTMYRSLLNMLKQTSDDVLNSLHGGLGQKFRAIGITSVEQLMQAYKDARSLSPYDYTKKYGQYSDEIGTLTTSLSDTDLKNLNRFLDGEKALSQTIAAQNGVVGDNLDHFTTLGSLINNLNIPTMTLADATAAYNQQVQSSIDRHRPMAQAIQLNLLNYYRLQAGLGKATSLEQGFGDAVDSGTGKLNKNSQAAKINADAFSQLTDTMKNAYQNAQQAAVSAADTIWNYAVSSQQAAMQKSTDAQDKAFDKQERGIEKHYNHLKAAVKKRYNMRINAIQKEIDAENKAEQRRQAIFEAEQTRLQRQAEMANNAIDFNVALNTGNLDEAAKIFSNMQSTQDKNAIEDAKKNDQTASERRIADLEKEKKQVEKLRDAKLKALQREEDAEKRALERRKKRFDEEAAAKQESLQRELDMRKAYLDLEIQAITSNIPTTKAQYEKQIGQIEAAYKAYGVDLKGYGDQWGGYVGAALKDNVKAAANGLRSDINWQHIAYKVASEFAKGAFGLTLQQFAKWISTGKLPKSGIHPQDSKGNPNQQRLPDGRPIPHGLHSGGQVGNGPSNLAGRSRSSSLYRDERLVRAQVGEYMINKDAARALGTDALDHINALGRHSGGAIGPGGIAMGMMGGMMAGTVYAAMSQAAQKRMSGFGSIFSNIAGGIPKVGSFAKINDDALRNAAIIVAVGRAMGATKKDEITALAVALVESGLHNLPYGDRDSLGLFQQRPSQGWGTPQQIMNPRYSAHAFYASLMRYPQRSQWPIGKAAQIVQRSAYPDIYYGMVPKARSVYGAVLPSLFTGGKIKYDNTIANLHKKETVLTAPLSASLERGIERFEKGGGGDTYHVTLDMRGATIKEDVDIERAVDKALAKRDGKRGRSRKIGDFND